MDKVKIMIQNFGGLFGISTGTLAATENLNMLINPILTTFSLLFGTLASIAALVMFGINLSKMIKNK